MSKRTGVTTGSFFYPSSTVVVYLCFEINTHEWLWIFDIRKGSLMQA
jgi:hypothetical protein